MLRFVKTDLYPSFHIWAKFGIRNLHMAPLCICKFPDNRAAMAVRNGHERNYFYACTVKRYVTWKIKKKPSYALRHEVHDCTPIPTGYVTVQWLRSRCAVSLEKKSSKSDLHRCYVTSRRIVQLVC
jgi:hypothetical protein